MKTFLLAVTLTCSSLSIWAQDKITDELKTLSESKQFDEITKKYTSNVSDYTAKSLYYIGAAYFMKEDSEGCIKYLDLSIAKDPKDPKPYYLKAMTFFYMEKFTEAIILFKTAISLQPDDAENYSALGGAYYGLKQLDDATAAYTKATTLDKCPDAAYNMLAQILTEKGQHIKALEAYYVAKSKIPQDAPSYINTLYNIGLLEYLHGDLNKAATSYLTLLQLSPDDIGVYPKLIQIYYRQKDYDKAKPYKDKLYEASKKGKLPDHLKDDFCIDQFKWKDYDVIVYERYENENKGRIYNKQLFYVMDKDGNTVLRVQTEFSPISVELKGPKYLLCATKGNTHLNPAIGVNDDTKYDDLKSWAVKLFEKYMKE